MAVAKNLNVNLSPSRDLDFYFTKININVSFPIWRALQYIPVALINTI